MKWTFAHCRVQMDKGQRLFPKGQVTTRIIKVVRLSHSLEFILRTASMCRSGNSLRSPRFGQVIKRHVCTTQSAVESLEPLLDNVNLFVMRNCDIYLFD